MKKLLKFLGSMGFAITLLMVLAAACVAASFVTQGQSYAWYAEAYSESAARLIVGLRLDDAFHSWWLLTLTAFLCGNLLLCNLTRLKSLVARTRREADPAAALNGPADAACENVADPLPLFERLRLPKPKVCEIEGKKVLFSGRNRLGLWGPWVCHLGILLLILGFTLGQLTHREYTVYGVPGDTKPIGETGYYLTIDDFEVRLRDDDTVAQYVADVTIFRAPQGSTAVPDSQSDTVSVNHPARLFGFKVYQNSTGYAARISVDEDGTPLQTQIVCAGEGIKVADAPDLRVYLNAFYPDFYLQPGVGPTTLSGRMNNPAYLYSITYGDSMVGMNYWQESDGPITVNDYAITFSEPQNYTLLQVKVDRFQGLALLGGLVTMLGLVLALYLLPAKAWAVAQADGTWTILGQSRKGGALFREEFARAAGRDEVHHEKGDQA
jgi:cytochrome c biogenesis protein